ncbi:MAG: sigma-70 family RNA polymerase sigma factor [Clostridia bacterium]|nr:sigma-70 family RNA polymerase sigma factor [Clostridia bacterium]
MAELNTQQLSELVRKLQSGDGAAFNEIYEATRQPAYFTALKIAKNEQDAEDILQEAYIQLLDKINTLENPDTFIAWFNRIVANKAKDFLKKKNPLLFKDAEAEQFYTEEQEDDDRDFIPEDSMDKTELRREMMRIIDGLNDDQRACILLYYYDEMPVKEIAASLDVSESAVKSRLFHARKEIKAQVEALAKQNKALFGVAPMPLVIWALKSAGAAAAASSAASGAAAATLAAVTATAGGAAAATATGTAASAGAAAAKAVGAGLAQKLIAGLLAVTLIGGGTIAGTKLVQRHRDDPADATAAQSVTTEGQTKPVLSVLTPENVRETVTVPDDRNVQADVQLETLRYGVRALLPNFAERTQGGVQQRNGASALDRQSFRATYQEMLPYAKQNITTYSAQTDEIRNGINRERVAQGLPALVDDSVLTEQAAVRAEEIAWSDRNSMTRPDETSYTTVFDQNDLVSGARYEARAYHYDTPEEAVQALLKNGTVLQPNADRIGIGAAEDPETKRMIYVVHLYSADGDAEQTQSAAEERRDRWNSFVDSQVAGQFDVAETLNEWNERGRNLPVIGPLFDYNFHNDWLLLSFSEFMEQMTDELNAQAEQIETERGIR